MKLDAIEKKLDRLESRFYSGQVKSIDDHGHDVWVKGSGLEFVRTVLKAKCLLGKEALPKDLQREVRLWSRAELPECGLSDMLKEMCRGLVNESG
jgi:hypothetical protein